VAKKARNTWNCELNIDNLCSPSSYVNRELQSKSRSQQLLAHVSWQASSSQGGRQVTHLQQRQQQQDNRLI
jgi:hypothetical protein